MDNIQKDQQVHIFDKIVAMELKALDKFCDYNNIAVKDYVNLDVMGEEDYQEYLQLYSKHFNYCFECGENPCDIDCPYQVDKGDKNE